MMNLWQATVLAIIEGLTEFLPISSTAHLVLVSDLLRISQSEFVKTFEIGIQAGTIMAIISLYFQRVWGKWELIKKLVVSFIPTGMLGLLLYKFIKNSLLGNTSVAIAALAVGGVIMIIWESKKKTQGNLKIEELSYGKCVGIGLAQSLAMIPGISRSAATIFGGLGLGLSRKEAVEMSFLLAVPTLAAATGWDMVKSLNNITKPELGLLAWGGLVAWITGMLVVKWLVKFVKTHDMRSFGWYRIVLAAMWMISGLGLH